MGSILIAMSRLEDANKIAGLLKGQGFPFDIIVCDTGAEILRIANDRDSGVVICGKSLKDMSYAELGGMLPVYFGVVVLTKDASLDIVGETMVKLQMPFKVSDLINTIDMQTQTYIGVRRKKKPPARNEEDKKLVDRAKYLLMDRNGLSEEEAFRYIQKNSMDYGRKMVESAQMILTLYSDK